MKAPQQSRLTGIMVCISIFWQSSFPVFSQVQTPRHIPVEPNCQGFYEYLPSGYSSGSQTYPLMLFIHGIGELGDGQTQLPYVLRNGPPKLINLGTFPSSFTVNGKQFSFIVISPQFIIWPSQLDINNLLNYIIAHYRVDTSRIYLTGLSMGGGVVWDYSGDVEFPYGKRLAAILPISGASTPDSAKSRVIAADNLPVWALQNQYDPTVPVSNTIGYINFINDPPAPTPPAKMTIFPVHAHDAWTQAYDPDFTDAGLNVYQWMLQFQNGLSNPLPILLSDFELTQIDNQQVNIQWSTSMEQNNAFFTIERSSDGIQFEELAIIRAEDLANGSHYAYLDKTVSAGMNYYRLSQTDLDGKSVHLGVKDIMIKEGTSGSLAIFPSPAKAVIFLQLNHPETGSLSVRIINSGGSVIKTLQASKENTFWQQQMTLDELTPGIYRVEVRGKSFRMLGTFIKN